MARMALMPPSLVQKSKPFLVQKSKPVVVTPARPTPREFKCLPDIDDQEALRFHISIIQYYKNEPNMKGKDPVTVIKEAVAEALVVYYPFAGRLREEGDKLTVECGGEGVLFIEADADIRLEDLGDRLPPPLPWLGEFLHEVPGSEDVVGCPLLVIQVTRLDCGGFVVAVRHNHTMADAQGIVQFLNAVSDFARGMTAPSIQPVWDRHLLDTCNSSLHITNNHGCDKPVELSVDGSSHQIGYGPKFPSERLVHRSFFFGPKEISVLKQQLPDRSTTFEVVTATSWRSRTIALCLSPDETVRLKFIANIRSKIQPPLPVGYYGNALVAAEVLSTAGQLCQEPLSYAVDLIKKAKAQITRESVKPFNDVMPLVKASIAHLYLVSDNTRSGFDEVDYGWGKPVFGGLGYGDLPPFPGVMSFYVPFKTSLGEKGVVVPMCLPEDAMERYAKEVERFIR